MAGCPGQGIPIINFSSTIIASSQPSTTPHSANLAEGSLPSTTYTFTVIPGTQCMQFTITDALGQGFAGQSPTTQWELCNQNSSHGTYSLMLGGDPSLVATYVGKNVFVVSSYESGNPAQNLFIRDLKHQSNCDS